MEKLIKKFLGVKWELIILIGIVACVITSYSLWVDSGDIRAKILMYISGVLMLINIFGYKTIQEFRRYVVSLW